MSVRTSGSYYCSPPIVTNGLVWYVDPINENSYKSGSLNVNDISGYNTTVTLSNRNVISSSTDLGTYFDFQKGFISSSAATSVALNDLPMSGGFTYTQWLRVTSSTDFGIVFHKGTLTGFFPAWQIWLITGAQNGMGLRIWVDASNASYVINTSSGSYPVNQWFNFTSVFDGNLQANTGSAIYINGLQQPFNFTRFPTGSTYGGTDAGTPLNMATASQGAAPTWAGKSSIVSIYNRPLSAAEVKQNFNAQKTRFGLL